MKIPTLANATRAFCVTAMLAVSSYLQAQSCSGGPDGGMDATGNQCSVIADLADVSRADLAARESESVDSGEEPAYFGAPAAAMAASAQDTQASVEAVAEYAAP